MELGPKTRHEILGGLVKVYRRNETRHWHCSASVSGKQFRTSTKTDELARAKDVAEDWYLGLRGKARAGLLKSDKTFSEAAAQFEKEYQVITEGQRSARWTDGHKARIRIHLRPFFGTYGISEVTPGKVQEYRVHRMTVDPDAHPAESKSNRKPKTTPPSRSTLHDEIVTLRLVLKTAVRHGWLTHLPDAPSAPGSCFDPRPRVSGRHDLTDGLDDGGVFRSTPARERATRLLGLRRRLKQVSIHARA